jgi:hypothetical protein
MASIIVLVPVYFILMWLIRRDIKRDHTRKDIWVRRWAIILTLFVTGLAIVIDLISVLTTFFNGESFTLSFVLKTVLILLVAAAAFMHFIADLWGYWDHYPERKRSVGIAIGILAVMTIVAGFFIIGTPMQAMSYQFDEQKVNDLQTIQSEIVSYWQQNGKLPATLAQIGQPLTGETVPVDEQTGDSYQYTVVSKLSFKLCATFNAATAPYAITTDELAIPAPVTANGSDDSTYSWYHDAGTQCFLRTINPSQYPVSKPQ